MARSYIRIVGVPPGEAPEEVRRAWVGVRIPLPRFHARPKAWRTAGVLTGPRTLAARLAALWSGRLARSRGYAVSAVAAIAALEAEHPEAARWWREHAPHVLTPGKAFVFAAEACVEERGDPEVRGDADLGQRS